MLYVTTREKFDAYTAARTLAGHVGPDGGAYLPFRMPLFSREELAKMGENSFGQNMADMLNLFFSCGLTAWDIDSAIGKNPVKIAAVGNRISCAQLWQNLDGSYEKLEKVLGAKVCQPAVGAVNMTSWLRIAIRVAVLFGVFAQLRPQDAINVSVPSDDFTLPMAVWYSRCMGLPIGRIICGCRSAGSVWELLHLGEMKTDGYTALNREVERLVFATLGREESKRFAAVCDNKGIYKLLPVDSEKLSSGMFGAVISDERIASVIPSVYRTNAYLLAEDSATAYSALMDYRAKTGSNRDALLLEDAAPTAL